MAARETEEKGGTTDVTSDKVETEKASKAVAEPKQGSEDGKELSKPIAAPEKVTLGQCRRNSISGSIVTRCGADY